MNHLFIPYQLALQAEHKGFNLPCLSYYQPNIEGKVNQFFVAGDQPEIIDPEVPHITLTPLYQQMVDWFREEHNTHIEVSTRGEDSEYPKWQYWLVNTKKSNRIELALNELEQTEFIEFNSYYEALNAAITEAFKLT